MARGGYAVGPGGPLSDACFFALTPDRAAAIRIGDVADWLRRGYRLKGEIIAAERLHVTLHDGVLPGAAPGELISRMCAAGDTVSAGGFALGFDHAMSFARNAGTQAVVLLPGDRMRGLEELFLALGSAMAAKGLRVGRSFTPHLTLLYDAVPVPLVGVELVRWMVHDFVLIRSLRGCSHYQFLGRWPLRPIRL
jgi:2'-5' RNA ligase